MKKIVSVLLVLCTLSLCLLLSACGGKNSYQTFIKENTNKEFEIKKADGESLKNEVTDYYNLEGKISISYKCVMYADVVETTRDAKNQDQKIVDLTVLYDMREEYIEVVVEKYTYSSQPVIEGTNTYYTWKDGYTFETPKNSDGAMLTRFKFDINKYFESGKLTVEDAQEAMALDATGIKSDLSWPTTDSKYTSRNTDWEADALADIMETVNEVLAQIDAVVEK